MNMYHPKNFLLMLLEPYVLCRILQQQIDCTNTKKDGPTLNLERCCKTNMSRSGYCNFFSSPCMKGWNNSVAKSMSFANKEDAVKYSKKMIRYNKIYIKNNFI